MTEILATGNDRRRPGVRRKKIALRIDMTPMVDLGFLLIAFFIMTTNLSKPYVVKLNMPADGPPSTLGESNALTVLLASNNIVYYYEGDWKDASAKGAIFKTTFSVSDGIGKVIREKQKRLDITDKKEGRNGLMLLIKPAKESSYQNVIDALDETMINAVKKYSILKTDAVEIDWLAKQR